MARKKAETTTATATTNGATAIPGGWTDDPDRAARDASHLEAMEAAEPGPAVHIKLPHLDIQNLMIRLVGDSPLIVHKWSVKAIKKILDKQVGNASEGKKFKDPMEEYESTIYRLPDGSCGFPAIAFKNAAVSACTSLGKTVTKVRARQAFHCVGELVRIEGEPSMREDMVRIGMGTTDIRYRAEFKKWACNVSVRFNGRVISPDELVNLFNTAGFAVGVGEWRSERDGSFGLFHVEGY